jgi:hypothetical protein
VSVDLKYRDEPLFRDGNPPPIRTRHVRADVTPGKVGKIPLTRDGDAGPRRWFEIMVHKGPYTGSLLPPRKAKVFTMQFRVTEKQGQEEEQIAAPTLLVLDGHQAHFHNGTEARLADTTVQSSGLSCVATIKSLKDGRLRLEMQFERRLKKHEDRNSIQVQSRGLHILKVVRPGETVELELDSNDTNARPARVQVVVNAAEQ